jgi:hypothetical protein
MVALLVVSWPRGFVPVMAALALTNEEPCTLSRIYIPTSSPEQWAQFLAEPAKHWQSIVHGNEPGTAGEEFDPPLELAESLLGPADLSQ